MPTPDRLNETFEAWHRAVDEHIRLMRDVTAGAPLDNDSMSRKIAEIDTLHDTWMDLVMRREADDKSLTTGQTGKSQGR